MAITLKIKTDSVVFFAGGQGSGKSTVMNKYVEQKQSKLKSVVIVAPDALKETHPDYQRELTTSKIVSAQTLERVHLWSISEARRLYQQELATHSPDGSKVIIYDSTLGNLPRSKEMISEAKQTNFDVKTVLVYCPLDLCLQRVASRAIATGRSVPLDCVRLYNPIAVRNFVSLEQEVKSWRIYRNLDEDFTARGTPIACGKPGKTIDGQTGLSCQIPDEIKII